MAQHLHVFVNQRKYLESQDCAQEALFGDMLCTRLIVVIITKTCSKIPVKTKKIKKAGKHVKRILVLKYLFEIMYLALTK